jgi:hypothetical protein
MVLEIDRMSPPLLPACDGLALRDPVPEIPPQIHFDLESAAIVHLFYFRGDLLN